MLFEHSRLRSVVVICLHFYSQKSVVKPVSKSKPSANRLPYIFSKYTDDRPIVLTFNIDFSGKEIHTEFILKKLEKKRRTNKFARIKDEVTRNKTEFKDFKYESS